MKQIKAWETSDGKIFQSSDEASKHEFFLEMRRLFKETSPALLDSQLEDLWVKRFNVLDLILSDKPQNA